MFDARQARHSPMMVPKLGLSQAVCDELPNRMVSEPRMEPMDPADCALALNHLARRQAPDRKAPNLKR